MATKACPECGKEFEVILEGAEYCSYDCEVDANDTIAFDDMFDDNGRVRSQIISRIINT